MPAIHRTDFSHLYVAADAASKAKGEGNDCAVKALSIACGVTYDEAHAALAAAGRDVKDPTPMAATLAAVEALGFKAEQLTAKEVGAIVAAYPGIHATLKHVTTHHPRRFPKVWDAHKGETYLMRARKHIAAYTGGTVHDWSVNKALQLVEIYRVTKDGQPVNRYVAPEAPVEPKEINVAPPEPTVEPVPEADKPAPKGKGKKAKAEKTNPAPTPAE